MRILLMHPEEDFHVEREPPPGSVDLVEDLGLGLLFQAMAGQDQLVLAVAKAAVLCPLAEPEEIVWRQQVLTDCIANPGFAKELYVLATETLDNHRRRSFWGTSASPESLRYASIEALEMLLGQLVRLRRLMEGPGQGMSSRAFARLRSMLVVELDDAYMTVLQRHLDELKLTRGLYVSAQLGRANKATAYLLHTAPPRGWRERLANRGQRGLSFTVPERDENGLRALGELQAKGVNIAANALAQSVEKVLGLFTSLRTELAFYIGCLNLHDALSNKGEPICTPVPLRSNGGFKAEGLYDPSLSLGTEGRVVGNDVVADGKALVVITGANRGGKSTFLRSVGIAQLMLQSGMFAPATSFEAGLAPRMFTHFKRDEDAAMRGGKLDEELRRMSTTISQISRGSVLLCNEPFGSTNEREGSDIGRQVFLPLIKAGVSVFVVTHLYDLAESLYNKGLHEALFLHAPRQIGAKPFKLVEGAPEATAYGEDVYQRVFGERPTGRDHPREAAAGPATQATSL
ncbi:MAG TPA: hypothetical protein VL984_05930 [Acidimicrobiales bacterium]|nr:hypothetical protein [Acidimicrobiales bacterium]